MKFAAITMSIGLLVLGGLMAMITRAIVTGEWPLNSEVGFRTKATKASAEAWKAGHEATVPLLRFAWPIVAGPALTTLASGFFVTEE